MIFAALFRPGCVCMTSQKQQLLLFLSPYQLIYTDQLAMEWTGWDILLDNQHLNPWPPACKAGDLPLIYRPLFALARIWRLIENKRRR